MTTLTFQKTTLSVINQQNQIWFSISDIASALGYKETNGVTRLYNAHQDEFTPCMTALVDTQTNGGIQKVRIFSLRGTHLIGMLSHTKVAKEFRKWVLDILDREVSQNSQQIAPLAPETLTPEEQLMVQNAVRATHDRTGLSYGEIWARTKNKFKVAKYEQIERTQLRDVLIYIASISAIRTAGKDEIIVPANIFAAIMQHTRLARKLAEKVEPFHRQLQEIMGIDRWCKNDIAALAYDVRAEFNYFLEKGEDLVEQNRREQNEINFANARLKKII